MQKVESFLFGVIIAACGAFTLVAAPLFPIA